MKKYCRQCDQDVRRADYYRHPYTADGLMAVCKGCHRANVKANREANAGYYREYERGRSNLPHRVEAREQYAQTPEGKAAHIRAHRRQRELRPLQRKARVIAGNAIRDGRLTRKPCEVCGNVVVTVIGVEGGRVMLGIEAPREVSVLRGELLDRQPGAAPRRPSEK
jgi:hypothetical protein